MRATLPFDGPFVPPRWAVALWPLTCLGAAWALALGLLVFALVVWPRPLAEPKNLHLVAHDRAARVVTALERHVEREGGLPDTLDELTRGEGALVPADLLDPWGRPFRWEARSRELLSLGAEGRPGGLKGHQDVRIRVELPARD